MLLAAARATRHSSQRQGFRGAKGIARNYDYAHASSGAGALAVKHTVSGNPAESWHGFAGGKHPPFCSHPRGNDDIHPLNRQRNALQATISRYQDMSRATAWHRGRLSHGGAATRAQSLSFKRLGAHTCAQAPAPQAEHGAPSRLCESMAPLRSFLPPEQTAIRTGGNKLRRCS